MAGIVGPQADGGKSRLKNRYPGARNRQVILVHDREDDRRTSGGGLPVRKDYAEEEGQDSDEALHAVATRHGEKS
jgi:hypothetical protein